MSSQASPKGSGSTYEDLVGVDWQFFPSMMPQDSEVPAIQQQMQQLLASANAPPPSTTPTGNSSEFLDFLNAEEPEDHDVNSTVSSSSPSSSCCSSSVAEDTKKTSAKSNNPLVAQAVRRLGYLANSNNSGNSVTSTRPQQLQKPQMPSKTNRIESEDDADDDGDDELDGETKADVSGLRHSTLPPSALAALAANPSVPALDRMAKWESNYERKKKRAKINRKDLNSKFQELMNLLNLKEDRKLNRAKILEITIDHMKKMGAELQATRDQLAKVQHQQSQAATGRRPEEDTKAVTVSGPVSSSLSAASQAQAQAQARAQAQAAQAQAQAIFAMSNPELNRFQSSLYGPPPTGAAAGAAYGICPTSAPPAPAPSDYSAASISLFMPMASPSVMWLPPSTYAQQQQQQQQPPPQLPPPPQQVPLQRQLSDRKRRMPPLSPTQSSWKPTLPLAGSSMAIPSTSMPTSTVSTSGCGSAVSPDSAPITTTATVESITAARRMGDSSLSVFSWISHEIPSLLGFLDAWTLTSVMQTCRELRDAAKSDFRWQLLCQRRWFIPNIPRKDARDLWQKWHRLNKIPYAPSIANGILFAHGCARRVNCWGLVAPRSNGRTTRTVIVDGKASVLQVIQLYLVVQNLGPQTIRLTNRIWLASQYKNAPILPHLSFNSDTHLRSRTIAFNNQYPANDQIQKQILYHNDFVVLQVFFECNGLDMEQQFLQCMANMSLCCQVYGTKARQEDFQVDALCHWK